MGAAAQGAGDQAEEEQAMPQVPAELRGARRELSWPADEEQEKEGASEREERRGGRIGH
jgi:hypothetical protein